MRVLPRRDAQMPLARKERAIATGPEHLGERGDVGAQIAFMPRLPLLIGGDKFGHRAEARLMIIDA